jgi:hypothetical protein
VKEFQQLKSILDLCYVATGMQINMSKSTMLISIIKEELLIQLDSLLPFNRKSIEEGIKYLGFKLKPCSYLVDDWMWLPKKIQARIYSWNFHLLSRGGRLVLIKYVLSSISVYWASIAKIPKGILTQIRKLWFQFLWSSKKDVASIPLVK